MKLVAFGASSSDLVRVFEEPTPHQQTSGSDEDHRTEVHQDPNMPPNKQSINPHVNTVKSEAELLQVLKTLCMFTGRSIGWVLPMAGWVSRSPPEIGAARSARHNPDNT